MDFQSPTSQHLTIPEDSKTCSTPEQCVLYAFSALVRRRNKSLKESMKKSALHKNRKTRSARNEILTFKEIEAAVKQYFPKRAAGEWISDAVQSLASRGTLLNVNDGCENMAPAFRCTASQFTSGSSKQTPMTTKQSETAPSTSKAGLARKKTVINRKIKKLKAVNKNVRKRR